ncbi:MAG: transposase [Clostridia bacterium]|nr:transposase [Clostridia bacterium]
MADLKNMQPTTNKARWLRWMTLPKTGKKFPKISEAWRKNRANLSSYFKFLEQLRRIIYTTNNIVGCNLQLRNVTKSNRFPNR